jgi:biopolymer transport protein ExbD
LAALVAAACAWALVGADDFRGCFGLGLIALASGITAIVRGRPGRIRVACIILALSALPATAAIRMWRIADGFEPYAIWMTHNPLGFLDLPVVPEGTFDPRFPPRRIVNLTAGGEVLVRGEPWKLHELSGAIAAGGDAPVLIRADYTTPWLHFTWLLDAARKAGATEVRFAAAKHVQYRIHREDRSQIRGETHGGDWPELELTLPLRPPATGSRLLLAADAREARTRGWNRTEFEFPVKVRYELDGRYTTDLDELSRWMRDRPPARVEADVDVPLMLVASVLNELVRIGHPMPALVTPRVPTSRELQSSTLSWPSR